jgi:hypothetical protein
MHRALAIPMGYYAAPLAVVLGVLLRVVGLAMWLDVAVVALSVAFLVVAHRILRRSLNVGSR